MWNKEKAKEYGKKYRLRNKEKTKEYNKRYRLENKEKYKEYDKKRYLQNIEKIKKQVKQYQLENKEKRNQYRNNKRKTDINYKLSENLRTRLRIAIKRNQKTGSAVRDLGCTVNYFKKYLKNQFKEGMTWENYGEWHIDHIISISSFDLTNRNELLKAVHYTNLQPLWAEENFKKSNKI